MTGAAFFDLDRTLIRRSSALALAGSFRERGLIGRGQLARAALWQLLYAEPLALARRHRERGERTYIVSAALQEIVDALAEELDFDGAIGSLGEVEDGVFTGRVLRSCHHEAKAEALVELAARDGIDLAASIAYSDSASDLPFLDAVGSPVVVNPDRELRRVASERGWPVLEFGELLYPAVRRRLAPAAAVGAALGAGAAYWATKRRAA